MASAMSTLRLDNYVYTEEGIRSAWQRVSPKGHLSLAMSCVPGRWFFERLYWTITKATGQEPIAVFTPLHGWITTFIVPGPEATLNSTELSKYSRIRSDLTAGQGITMSDDWPFLYLRPAVMPCLVWEMGIRPNSPPQMISVLSSSPRCFKSLISAAEGLSVLPQQ